MKLNRLDREYQQVLSAEITNKDPDKFVGLKTLLAEDLKEDQDTNQNGGD